MILYFIVFGFIALSIFNLMTNAFCVKVEASGRKQSKIFLVNNMIMVLMLVSYYVDVANVAN